VTVRTDDAIPPAGGVTGVVPKTRFKPAGAPELVRSTGAVKTPTDCTVIVEGAEAPGLRDIEDGDTVIAKSAVPALICTATSAV
jgi:hypothetical protein